VLEFCLGLVLGLVRVGLGLGSVTGLRCNPYAQINCTVLKDATVFGVCVFSSLLVATIVICVKSSKRCRTGDYWLTMVINSVHMCIVSYNNPFILILYFMTL